MGFQLNYLFYYFKNLVYEDFIMEKEAEVKRLFKYDTTTATITTTNILGHSTLCSAHRNLIFFFPLQEDKQQDKKINEHCE